MRITSYSENGLRKQINMTIQMSAREFEEFNLQNFEPLDIIKAVKSKYNPQAIQELIYEYFELSMSLQEKMRNAKEMGRAARLVYIRRLCYYFIRRYTDLPLRVIGELYGQDHATVMHHIRYVDDILEIKGKEMSADVDDINRAIINQLS